MEFLTYLWNNQPNVVIGVVIGVGIATAVLLGIYIFLLDILSKMLRLLPLPIFICIYLFSWWRCKKNIIASDKQLKPCIDWAYLKNLPLPKKPSFVEFYIVYVSSFFKFPFGIIIQQLPFAKKVRYYEREMKLIFDKWNLEKIKKITN